MTLRFLKMSSYSKVPIGESEKIVYEYWRGHILITPRTGLYPMPKVVIFLVAAGFEPIHVYKKRYFYFQSVEIRQKVFRCDYQAIMSHINYQGYLSVQMRYVTIFDIPGFGVKLEDARDDHRGQPTAAKG